VKVGDGGLATSATLNMPSDVAIDPQTGDLYIADMHHNRIRKVDARTHIITTVAGLIAYVAIALGYSTVYQATVKLGLWRSVVETLDISNLAVLEQVTAAGQPASPVGEGLADALSVGGI